MICGAYVHFGRDAMIVRAETEDQTYPVRFGSRIEVVAADGRDPHRIAKAEFNAADLLKTLFAGKGHIRLDNHLTIAGRLESAAEAIRTD
jgi:hypothetical protein